MNSPVFVYIDLNGQSHLAGRLWPYFKKGRESATFEYDRSWLSHPNRFALEPALQLGIGPYHTGPDKAH